MNRSNSRPVLALVLSVGGMLSIGTSQAVTQSRVFSANATSYCQSALLVFDGQIRKRPLAVQNEGDKNAYVTCSFTRQNGQNPASDILMSAINIGAVDRSLTCTLVVGKATSVNPPTYLPKTTIISAGFSDMLTWDANDFGGTFPNGQYSMSCNLLPGVGLADSYLIFTEDVGQ